MIPKFNVLYNFSKNRKIDRDRRLSRRLIRSHDILKSIGKCNNGAHYKHNYEKIA